jgi:hypothetical protein
MTARELIERLSQVNPEALVLRGDSEYGCFEVLNLVLADESYRAAFRSNREPGQLPRECPDATVVIA